MMKIAHDPPKRTTSVCSQLNYSDEDQEEDIFNENNSYIKLLWNVHRSLEMVRGETKNTTYGENPILHLSR